MKASEWAFDGIREAFELVAQDEAEKVSIVQENHAQKHGLLAAHHRASRRHNVVLVPALQQFSHWKTPFGGSLGRKHARWWCATCGETYRLLVVQTGESFEQAKVFEAHAVPLGLCANLINALKLLANQQKDGDGLLQNIREEFG